MSPEMRRELRTIVLDILRDSPAAHRRRCAIRLGVRETDPDSCRRMDWDYSRHWCERCGVTLEEIMFWPRERRQRFLEARS